MQIPDKPIYEILCSKINTKSRDQSPASPRHCWKPNWRFCCMQLAFLPTSGGRRLGGCGSLCWDPTSVGGASLSLCHCRLWGGHLHSTFHLQALVIESGKNIYCTVHSCQGKTNQSPSEVKLSRFLVFSPASEVIEQEICLQLLLHHYPKPQH